MTVFAQDLTPSNGIWQEGVVCISLSFVLRAQGPLFSNRRTEHDKSQHFQDHPFTVTN